MAFTDLIRWRRPTSLIMSDDPVLSLQREMNRTFENFWNFWDGSQEPQLRSEAGLALYPSIEVTDADKSIEVTAEVPGMTEKDIEVALSDDGEALMIEGEKKAEKEIKKENCYRAERVYGKFRRKIALPSRVDAANVAATCKDGVLKIHLPKVPGTEQRRKQISVKAG